MIVHSTESIELALNKAGTNANTTTGNGNTRFSVAFWMKVISGTAQVIMTKWDNSIPLGWTITFNNIPSAGTIYFDVFMDDTSLERATTNGVNVADGNWHQVVCTYDSTTGVVQNIYVDGVLRGTNNDPAPTSVNYDNSIALTMGALGGFSTTTRIDDARFYQRVLTATEAAQLYSNSEISTTSRQAYWPIEAGSGSVLADSTGNGNTLTFNIAPVWSSDVPAPLKNLLENPGFELWSGGTTFTFNSGSPGGPTADAWNGFWGGVDTNLQGTYSKDTSVFDTGLASMKIVASTTTFPPLGDGMFLRQAYTSPLGTHRRLTLTGRIRLIGGSSGVQVTAQVFQGNIFAFAFNAFAGVGQDTGWVTYTGHVDYTGTTPNLIEVQFSVQPGNGGNSGTGTAPQAWIDTLDLEAGSLVIDAQEFISPNDSEANHSTFNRNLAEAALAVEDAEKAITGRILVEAVNTGEWLDGEKNPAQNVWTTP